MKEVVFKPTFQKDFLKIPEKNQDIFYKLMEFLKADIFHPYLHTKSLSGKW